MKKKTIFNPNSVGKKLMKFRISKEEYDRVWRNLQKFTLEDYVEMEGKPIYVAHTPKSENGTVFVYDGKPQPESVFTTSAKSGCTCGQSTYHEDSCALTRGGERIWFVNSRGEIGRTDHPHSDKHQLRIKFGNAFASRKEAKVWRETMKDLFKGPKTGECCEKCRENPPSGDNYCAAKGCPRHQADQLKKIGRLVEKYVKEAYELGRKHQQEIDAHNKGI